ncbi:hypothetical protein DYQ05_01105 [Treponema pedis]|nr:hypothetical protein DYQ05_01105 [Treponema pedis]
MIFEGERTTFSDKSFPLPLIPPLFSKEPLRGSAPKNPAQKGTSCTFLGFEFSCSKLAGSFFGAGCGGKGAYALCLCARGWFFLNRFIAQRVLRGSGCRVLQALNSSLRALRALRFVLRIGKVFALPMFL